MNQLRSFSNARNMAFKIIDLRDYNSNTIGKLVLDIKRLLPTRIIFGFSSETYELLRIIKEMKECYLLEETAIEPGNNYVIYNTLNIFQNDECFLSSITATCYTGIEHSIFDALEDLASARQTKLLVISGSQGSKDGKDSGFKKPILLSTTRYKTACRFFKTNDGNNLPQGYSEFEPDEQ